MAFPFLLAGILQGQGSLNIVSAADYVPYDPVAPNSIVSLFAPNIAGGTYAANSAPPSPLPISLGGVSATVTDVLGTAFALPLLAVAPSQVNAVLPSELKAGAAVVTLVASNGNQVSGSITIAPVAPSLFTADQSGNWLAAAQVVILHADGSRTFIPSIATCTSNLVFNGSTWSGCVPIPVNIGSSSDQAVLELFGTGIRGVASVLSQCPDCGYEPVSAYVGPAYSSTDLPVLFAGAQPAFYGLDQVNVSLPSWLSGAGIIPITVEVLAGFPSGGPAEAADSNTVEIDIQ